MRWTRVAVPGLLLLWFLLLWYGWLWPVGVAPMHGHWQTDTFILNLFSAKDTVDVRQPLAWVMFLVMAATVLVVRLDMGYSRSRTHGSARRAGRRDTRPYRKSLPAPRGVRVAGKPGGV